MKFVVKTFNELTTQELYAILQLRSAIFVVEQTCIYQDIDGKDQDALHVFTIKDDAIAAYSRVFAPGFYFEAASIGRVIVNPKFRGLQLGHKLIKASIATVEDKFATTNIHISAQEHLKKFYEQHGFKQVGEGYLEDDIPHIGMDLKK